MKTKIYLCALAALFMIPQAMTAQTKKKAKKEVAIQLYSVRDILNKVDNKNGKCDPTYTALLKKLANMGYATCPIILDILNAGTSLNCFACV